MPEGLAEFATHAETGEPMPRDMLDRLLAAATYDTGFATVEYVASALVDLAFHDGPAPADRPGFDIGTDDLIAFGRQIGLTMIATRRGLASVQSGNRQAGVTWDWLVLGPERSVARCPPAPGIGW